MANKDSQGATLRKGEQSGHSYIYNIISFDQYAKKNNSKLFFHAYY